MLPKHPHIAKDGFRLRGIEMSRIDGFSDVVFGFALTLIVVSLEVPRTYTELHTVLMGFIPFAICFVFFIMVWSAHFRFFRRYGLHDAWTIVINAALLFTILFYVYPLKFLFSIVFLQVFGAVKPAAGQHTEEVFKTYGQIRELMTVYGAGFAATYFCFAGLYWNAWRQRAALHLNPLERLLTKIYGWDLFGVGCAGVVCCVLAQTLPDRQVAWAPMAFFLIALFKTIHGKVTGKRARSVRDSLPLEERQAAIASHATDAETPVVP